VRKSIRDLWNPGNDDIRQRQDIPNGKVAAIDGSKTNTEHGSSPTWPNGMENPGDSIISQKLPQETG
jgi:hypothetical protein